MYGTEPGSKTTENNSSKPPSGGFFFEAFFLGSAFKSLKTHEKNSSNQLLRALRHSGNPNSSRAIRAVRLEEFFEEFFVGSTY
jgi:hypothetical protein